MLIPPPGAGAATLHIGGGGVTLYGPLDTAAVGATNRILLEAADYVLMENNDFIELES